MKSKRIKGDLKKISSANDSIQNQIIYLKEYVGIPDLFYMPVNTIQEKRMKSSFLT